MLRCKIALVAALLIVSALGAGSASADVFLAFDKRVAAPGDTVSVYTANSRGDAAPFLYKGGAFEVYVYLAPVSKSASLLRTRDIQRRHVKVAGELHGDDESVARVTFKVPSLPPGVYSARMWCASCGSFLPDHRPASNVGKLGLLRVTAKRESRSSMAFPVAGAVLLVLVAAGAGVARRRHS